MKDNENEKGKTMAAQNFTHLPADIATALNDYDTRVANGTLEFDGEFAKETPDTNGGWIQSNVALHVSLMDS